MKRLLSLIICLSILVSAISAVSANAEFFKSYKSSFFVKEDFDDKFDDPDRVEKTFRLDKPAVLYFTFNVETDQDSDGNAELDINISNYDYVDDEENLVDDEFYIFIPKGKSKYTERFYTKTVYPAGKYELRLESNRDMTCKTSIDKYTSFSTDISVPKSITLKAFSPKTFSVKSKTPTGSFYGYKWRCTNKKIAEVTYNPSSKRITCYGKQPGKCRLIAKLRNGREYAVNVTVKAPKNPKLDKKKITLFIGKSKRVRLFSNGKKVKWSSDNKKIARVSKKGKVTAVNGGKCKIIAKCGGKTYKCSVWVKRRQADIEGKIDEYDTFTNSFWVWIKNKGTKNLRIHKTGSKCLDKDYDAFDRKLRLSGKKDLIIRPGKEKYVCFDVIGSATWPIASDYMIYLSYTYDKKKGYEFIS